MTPDNNKPTPPVFMIRLGVLMLIFNLFSAGYFKFKHDDGRVMMFLCGAVIWILAVLVWSRVPKEDTK